MPAYKYNGPINCDVDIDTSGLKGKTAIVTGGKNWWLLSLDPANSTHRCQRSWRSICASVGQGGVSIE